MKNNRSSAAKKGRPKKAATSNKGSSKVITAEELAEQQLVNTDPSKWGDLADIFQVWALHIGSLVPNRRPAEVAACIHAWRELSKLENDLERLHSAICCHLDRITADGSEKRAGESNVSEHYVRVALAECDKLQSNWRTLMNRNATNNPEADALAALASATN